MVNREIIEKIITKSIETAKTHDGTSMSKINASLDKFAEKYGKLTHEEISLFDEEGNEIYHNKGETHKCEVDEDQFINEGYKNLHVDHNHPTTFKGLCPTYLTDVDMENLLIKNKNGEYLYRSISAEAPNNSRMTLIRNNKFNDNDHDKFKEIIGNLSHKCLHYQVIEYPKKMHETLNRLAKSYTGDDKYSYLKSEEFYNKANKVALSELGTLEQYLKSEGLYSDLESVNCKLRIKQPS